MYIKQDIESKWMNGSVTVPYIVSIQDITKDSEIVKFADFLHEKFCNWNHTDGCSNYYHRWEDVLKNPKEFRHTSKLYSLIAALELRERFGSIGEARSAVEIIKTAIG